MRQGGGPDWDALADDLELEGSAMSPLLHEVLHDTSMRLDLGAVRHVIDVGAGPGHAALALAELCREATVTALDRSDALLDRLRGRLPSHPAADRIVPVLLDLESLGDAPDPLARTPADLVWASMVLHHVADPAATLRVLRGLMRPEGLLVIVEFAGPPAVLPPDDHLVVSGAWQRLERAIDLAVTGHLGRDPRAIDWPTLLRAARYTPVGDRTRAVYHDAPVPGPTRRWIASHVHRALTHAGHHLSSDDIRALQCFADEVAGRDDVFLRAERRVVVARRT